PVQIGKEYEAVGSGGGRQGQTVEPVRVGAEYAGRGTEHTCGVECGHERQVAAGGIGESADGAAGVLCGPVTDPEHGAAGAEGYHDVTGAQSQAKSGTHVVAGPGGHKSALFGAADLFRRCGDPRYVDLAAE